MNEATSILAQDFELFCEQCRKLEIILNMYEDLYEGDARQNELMRKMGNYFFADLSYILQNEFLIQVYKLTDHPGSGQRVNLTFLRIEMDLITCGLLTDETIQKEIADCVQIIQAFRERVAKEARNKVCAHLDREMLRELAKLEPHESGPGAHEDHERVAFLESIYKFIALVAGLLHIDVPAIKDVGRLPGASAKEMFQWIEHKIAKR
jgi:hypothetical protein